MGSKFTKNYYYLLPAGYFPHGPIEAMGPDDVKKNIKRFFKMDKVPDGTLIWEEGQPMPSVSNNF